MRKRAQIEKNDMRNCSYWGGFIDYDDINGRSGWFSLPYIFENRIIKPV
jgi:hypothetical protein